MGWLAEIGQPGETKWAFQPRDLRPLLSAGKTHWKTVFQVSLMISHHSTSSRTSSEGIWTKPTPNTFSEGTWRPRAYSTTYIIWMVSGPPHVIACRPAFSICREPNLGGAGSKKALYIHTWTVVFTTKFDTIKKMCGPGFHTQGGIQGGFIPNLVV